jgi:hypothetical protein
MKSDLIKKFSIWDLRVDWVFNLVDWGFNLGFRSGEMSKGLSLRFDILALIS